MGALSIRTMSLEESLATSVVHAPADETFVQRCQHVVQEEWRTLNQHLSGVDQSWGQLVASWDLDSEVQAIQWKSFAMPLLAARRSLARLSRDEIGAVALQWKEWRAAPIHLRRHQGLSEVDLHIVESHPVFAEEASDLSHPDVGMKVDLVGSLPSEFDATLTTALALIDMVGGRCRDVVATGFETLVVLELPPASPIGTCISFTSRAAPGAIFLTLTAPILLAESLVHESVHNVLYTATRLSPVSMGGRTMLKSPLRRDPRPLEGVVHQALVLDYLCELYERLLQHPTVNPVSRNIPQITQRLAKCREDRNAALHAISGVGHDLGPLGRELVSQLA
jgi:HEXXH motif-containing protein